MRRFLHLVTRFFGAIVATPLREESLSRVGADLSVAEMELWSEMSVADQSHSLMVLDRFLIERPTASRAERAGVLLHDVGKTPAQLGVLARVLATIVGPRTRRFRIYHDHEKIGAEMLLRAGSDALTVSMVRGDASKEVMAALLAADDI